MIALERPQTGSDGAPPGAEAAQRISEHLGALQRSVSEFTGQVRGAQEDDQKENRKSWGDAWKKGRAVVAAWNKFITVVKGASLSLAEKETLAVTGALLATGIQDLFLVGTQRRYGVKGSKFADRVESILQGILKVSFQHTKSAPLPHPQVRDLIKNPVSLSPAEPLNAAQSSLERFAAWYVLSVNEWILDVDQGLKRITGGDKQMAVADAETALTCASERPGSKDAPAGFADCDLPALAKAQCDRVTRLLLPTT